MSGIPIRIMTKEFQLLDEIDSYSSLQITRSWHGIGSIDLVINRYLKGADKLQRGHIIFPHKHLNKGYVIRHKQIELDENGKATENWVIKALSLKSWVSQRFTYPLPGKMADDVETNAESVIHHYIKNNVTDPVDVKRKMADIVVAENLNHGDNIKWSSCREDLSEVIKDISLQTGLGWNIEIDHENKKFVSVVNEGRNLTASQSDLPPAIFSPEFNTLAQMSYLESDLDYKNFAIVEGPNKPNQDTIPDEEKEKYMTEVGTSEGFERYEMLIGANVDTEVENEGAEREQRPDEDILADMAVLGTNELKGYTQEIYVEGQALTKSRLVYQHDYDLGDIVTLQNKDWGITMDARITEVKEIYEPGNIKIDLTFDNSFPTLIDKIKREIKRN